MIRCNLSVLLAERKLKITKVCNDTGISRTTLTYLANNYSKGIQYDTLNTLCSYLHITPGELISYVPVDIFILSINIDFENDGQLQIQLEITHNGITQNCDLCGNAYLHFSDFDDPYFNPKNYMKLPCAVDIDITLWDIDNDPEYEKENQFIIDAFHELPITFLKDIEANIIDDIINEIHSEYHLEDYIDQIEPLTASLSWDNALLKK